MLNIIKDSELTQKEVINVIDGKNWYITNVEIDLSKGLITAIIVPENERLWECLGKNMITKLVEKR